MLKARGTRQSCRLFQRHTFGASILLAVVLQGCVSVQFASNNGSPKIIGLGSAKPLDGARGQIYRIVAPGLSLRFDSYAPGLSLGWHETSLFYALSSDRTEYPNTPVAIQNICFGINLAPTQFTLGFARTFSIPLLPEDKSVIQFISYSWKNPADTIVERKEVE